ncbi:MAG: phosphate acyltransferase PlsX [Neomegalonema sp.]|nr:phosphate acyltransferase PlsX [Neomegalonema sp.]
MTPPNDFSSRANDDALDADGAAAARQGPHTARSIVNTPHKRLSKGAADAQPSPDQARASKRARKASPPPPPNRTLVLAIDAMSGEQGPAAALEGLASRLSASPAARAIVFGDELKLAPHAARLGAAGMSRIELRHVSDVIPMDARPRDALRSGRNTSMWRAIDAVATGEAHVAISAGNTAALMAMAAIRLRVAPGAPKPAIAALWPSRGPAGYNVVLDMGAGLEADADTLISYAMMGAAYARLALGRDRPRIGLLNVGSEEGKGRAQLRDAAQHLGAMTESGLLNARFIGFIEGDQIPSDRVDVVVTDGFTGNVALKTAEGTARLVGLYAREAFTGGWGRKLAAVMAYPALRALKQRMDPRRVNGGVFLGLNGAVVKSHGAADAVGFAAALRLAETIGQRGLVDAVTSELAKLASDSQYHATPHDGVGRTGAKWASEDQ